jgi:hypothetical protein
MPATLSKSQQASQRRERFREYMKKLNPTAPARLTIDGGLVVEDLRGSQFKALAARAELDPASQRVLACIWRERSPLRGLKMPLTTPAKQH